MEKTTLIQVLENLLARFGPPFLPAGFIEVVRFDDIYDEPALSVRIGDWNVTILESGEMTGSGHRIGGAIKWLVLAIPTAEADRESSKGIEVNIQDYQWLRVQGIINAAQKRLWNNVPGCYGRRLHAPAPVDDTSSIWRISSDYYQGGIRYGLRTEWIGTSGRPAMITVDNVVKVFTLLKDKFEEVDARTVWLPVASKYHVRDSTLWKGNKKVADLPSAAETKQEVANGSQEE